MEVIVKKNYEEMSKAAATLFAAEIMENPKTILGMATGSTPVGLYKELVKMYEAGDLDFSQVTTFNLDEARSHIRWAMTRIMSKTCLTDTSTESSSHRIASSIHKT